MKQVAATIHGVCVQTHVPSHPYHSQYVSRVQISSANISARKKRMCTCLCTVHKMLSVTCTDMSHEQFHMSYAQCHTYEHVMCLATHVQTHYMFTATCTDMSLDQSHMYVHTCHMLSITCVYILYTQGCLHMFGPLHHPTQQTHTLFCHLRYLRLQCLRREACVHNVLYDKRMWLAFEEGRVCTCATSHHTSGHNA